MKILNALLFCSFILASILSAQGVVLQKLPRLQPAGVYNLFAAAADTNDELNWEIFPYYVNENDGSYSIGTDTTFLSGDSVRVLFVKKYNYYTFYKIYVSDGIYTDSMTVQFINKGFPEKYLFANPDVPGKPLPIYIVLPKTFSPDSKFIMIMHGTNRNALDYVTVWKDFANENDFIAAAPLFSKTDWPNSGSYHQGNMFTASNGAGSLNPKNLWAFTVVSNAHLDLVDALGLKSDEYDIWGHSAGSQFVHRMMIFAPDYRIRYAISANAGWYTAPDMDIDYPYGLKSKLLSYDETFLEDLVIKKLIIMRGTADTLRTSNVNQSAEADAQGRNRYERAGYFFSYAANIDPNHKWQLIDVPGVGHDHTKMAPAAQQFLLNPTLVDNSIGTTPPRLELMQNYPNPFNPSTAITFSIPDVDKQNYSSPIVTLSVYDMLGQKIKTLVSERKTPGNYTIKFDSFGLPSGVYFYRLSVGSYSESKKMILIK